MALTCRFIPNRKRLEILEKEYSAFKPYYIEMLQALFSLSADLEKSLEQLHSKNNFSRVRYLILMVLLHEESGRLQPNEIAARLNVTRGNMTGPIDMMVKDGLVKKYQDTEDRRQVWVEITPKAETFLKKMMPPHFKRIAKFMSALTKEEGEQFIQLSRKLHASIGALTEEGDD